MSTDILLLLSSSKWQSIAFEEDPQLIDSLLRNLWRASIKQTISTTSRQFNGREFWVEFFPLLTKVAARSSPQTNASCRELERLLCGMQVWYRYELSGGCYTSLDAAYQAPEICLLLEIISTQRSGIFIIDSQATKRNDIMILALWILCSMIGSYAEPGDTCPKWPLDVHVRLSVLDMLQLLCNNHIGTLGCTQPVSYAVFIGCLAALWNLVALMPLAGTESDTELQSKRAIVLMKTLASLQLVLSADEYSDNQQVLYFASGATSAIIVNFGRDFKQIPQQQQSELWEVLANIVVWHSENLELMDNILAIFACGVGIDTLLSKPFKSEKTRDICRNILKVINAAAYDKGVLNCTVLPRALTVIGNIATHDICIQILIEERVTDSVLAVSLLLGMEMLVARSAAHVITNMTANGELAQLLGRGGVGNVILDWLMRKKDDADIVLLCAKSIWNLSMSEENKVMLASLGVNEALVSLLGIHSGHEQFLSLACQYLFKLVNGNISRRNNYFVSASNYPGPGSTKERVNSFDIDPSSGWDSYRRQLRYIGARQILTKVIVENDSLQNEQTKALGKTIVALL